MLIALRTGLGFRLAAMLALFAALCFAAPPAVLAFGHGGNALACLAKADKVNHGKPASHASGHHGDHASGGGDHSTPSNDHQMTCCGLFCLSAIDAEGMEIAPAAPTAALVPAREPILFSRVTERLDRPPISLLIV
jgi:hypothetical protein